MKCGIRSVIILLVAALTLASCQSSKRATVAQRADYESTAEHAKFVSHLPKQRKMIVEEAETWLGTPYRYAAKEKGVGTDCSGLVMQVYLTALDCPIPRNSAKQAEFCRPLKEAEIQAGDLVFFATGKDPTRVSHVGILIDNQSFIHASSSKGVVISKLANPWYARRLLMYGRIPALDDDTALR